MTERKDDGGPFHCSGTGYPQYYGASYRAVAAMHAMAALITTGCPANEVCALAVEYADALIAELKK